MSFLDTDFSKLSMPTNVQGSSATTALESLRDAIVGGYTQYQATRADLYRAKADAEIAKAQARGQVISAQTGLPSPSMMIYAGLGLAAILLLTRRK